MSLTKFLKKNSSLQIVPKRGIVSGRDLTSPLYPLQFSFDVIWPCWLMLHSVENYVLSKRFMTIVHRLKMKEWIHYRKNWLTISLTPQNHSEPNPKHCVKSVRIRIYSGSCSNWIRRDTPNTNTFYIMQLYDRKIDCQDFPSLPRNCPHINVE